MEKSPAPRREMGLCARPGLAPVEIGFVTGQRTGMAFAPCFSFFHARFQLNPISAFLFTNALESPADQVSRSEPLD